MVTPLHETESPRLHLALAASLAGLASALSAACFSPSACRRCRSTPVSYLWLAHFGNDAASLHVAMLPLAWPCVSSRGSVSSVRLSLIRASPKFMRRGPRNREKAPLSGRS